VLDEREQTKSSQEDFIMYQQLQPLHYVFSIAALILLGIVKHADSFLRFGISHGSHTSVAKVSVSQSHITAWSMRASSSSVTSTSCLHRESLIESSLTFMKLMKSPRSGTQKLYMVDGGPSFSSSSMSTAITVSPLNAVSTSTALSSKSYLEKAPTATAKLSAITSARTAVEAVNAVKTMAEQRNILLTQSEIESIPQLMIYYLTQAESNAKENSERKGNNVKYKPYLSSYMLADCAWGTGTLQPRKSNERIQQDNQNSANKRMNSVNTAEKKKLQRDYSTSTYQNKNEFYLSELAIKIITNLRMQNDHVKGRDFAKIMIGFERMGVQWDNITPDELAVVLTENVSNLDARGLSNVLWSLGHLYVQFDDLSVLLKVRT
jgi:hypothetical protein